MDRNLALEIVRVTEAAALAASRWVGKGDALSADRAAMSAMQTAFDDIPFSGRVVLGEGEPGTVGRLYIGDKVGRGGENSLDVAVDALECTRSVAFGRTNALSIVAMASTDSFLVPPSQYLEKLAVGPEAAGAIDLNRPVEENLERIAKAKQYKVSDLTVVILDRERHKTLINRVRQAGARIHLIPDGDVAASIATATPGSGVDILMGTGSASGGVLAAAALRCIGGEMQARLAPTDQSEAAALREAGFTDPNQILKAENLVSGDNIMLAVTGITDGDVLNGAAYRSDGATTHSMVLRSKTRTRRFIITEHFFEDSPIY